MPSILLIHDNFPAQFGGIAGYLAQNGWRVVFATAADHIPDDDQGVDIVRYDRVQAPSDHAHPYLRSTERAVRNAQAFVQLGTSLRSDGFGPDIIVAHSGWGCGSMAKTVWPDARLVQYLEWWYNREPVDQLPTLMPSNRADFAAKALCRNLPFLLDAQSADAILVPTRFQAKQIPNLLQPLVSVIHDGVDNAFYRPAQPGDPIFSLAELPDEAPIVTYAARGMEPMRGFPQFMEAWAKLQYERPDLHCVMAGVDRVFYGSQLPDGQSYKTAMLEKYNYDLSRLHFVGPLPKQQYRALLQRSAAHVHLTQPFVLSWSLIEAMMTGALTVASDVPPVREAAPAGTVNYIDAARPEEISEAVSTLLDDHEAARLMGQSARSHATRTYAADKLWGQLEAFYRSILAGGNS